MTEVDMGADIVGLLREWEADQRRAAAQLREEYVARIRAVYDREVRQKDRQSGGQATHTSLPSINILNASA